MITAIGPCLSRAQALESVPSHIPQRLRIVRATFRHVRLHLIVDQFEFSSLFGSFLGCATLAV